MRHTIESRSAASAGRLLALAGAAAISLAALPAAAMGPAKAPDSAATPAAAATAAAPAAQLATQTASANLPPAGVSGSAPSGPEAPQGLGIGAPSNGALVGVPPTRMVLETGVYRCELNRSVHVRAIAPDRQSMVISWLGKDHQLAAVDARSGALRYEDARAGLIWLVILGKSMLLDSRKGQQLANECRL